MGKKTDRYPPLQLLYQLTKEYPQMWAEMQYSHINNGNYQMPAWEKWCYVPVQAVLTALAAVENDVNEITLKTTAALQIAALAPWNLDRQVVIMDKRTEGMLVHSPDNLDLPSISLCCLPYYSYYIQTSELNLLGITYHGMFVFLDHEPVGDVKKLRLLFLNEDMTVKPYSFLIGEGSVEHCINKTVRETYEAMGCNKKNSYMADIWDEMNLEEKLKTFLKNALKIVLYTCARNATIVPSVDHLLSRWKIKRDSQQVIIWIAGLGEEGWCDYLPKQTSLFQICQRNRRRIEKKPCSFGSAAMRKMAEWDIVWSAPHFIGCSELDIPIDAEYEQLEDFRTE